MIIGNTLKRIFGKKSNILFMIVIPILLDIFLLSSSTSTVSYKIAVLDNDGSQFSQQIVSTLEKENKVKMINEVDEINELIINRSIDCAIRIPKELTQNILDGKEDVQVESYAISGTNSYQPIFMRIIGNFMPTTWFLKAGEAVLYGRGISAALSEIMYMILFSVILLVISFLVKTAKE